MIRGITLKTLEEAKEQAQFFTKYGSKTYIDKLPSGKYRLRIYAPDDSKASKILSGIEEEEISRATEKMIHRRTTPEEMREEALAEAQEYKIERKAREEVMQPTAKETTVGFLLGKPRGTLRERISKTGLAAKVGTAGAEAAKESVANMGQHVHVKGAMKSSIPTTSGKHPRIGVEGAVGVKTPRIGIIRGPNSQNTPDFHQTNALSGMQGISFAGIPTRKKKEEETK